MGDMHWPPIDMSDNFASSDFYKDGVRADAQKALDKASNFYRDTLRDGGDDDRGSVCSNSSRGSDSDFLDGRNIPEPWEAHLSDRRPGERYYDKPVTGKKDVATSWDLRHTWQSASA